MQFNKGDKVMVRPWHDMAHTARLEYNICPADDHPKFRGYKKGAIVPKIRVLGTFMGAMGYMCGKIATFLGEDFAGRLTLKFDDAETQAQHEKDGWTLSSEMITKPMLVGTKVRCRTWEEMKQRGYVEVRGCGDPRCVACATEDPMLDTRTEFLTDMIPYCGKTGTVVEVLDEQDCAVRVEWDDFDRGGRNFAFDIGSLEVL